MELFESLIGRAIQGVEWDGAAFSLYLDDGRTLALSLDDAGELEIAIVPPQYES